MQWWGWLILGSLATLAVVLLIMWIRQKPQVGLTDAEKQEVAKIKITDLNNRLKAETEEKEKLKEILLKQNEATKLLKETLEKEFKLIGVKKRAYLKKLLDDSDVLSSELDKLAGVSGNPDDKGTTTEG